MGCGSSSSAKGTVDKAKAPGGVVPSVIPGPLPQLTKENLVIIEKFLNIRIPAQLSLKACRRLLGARAVSDEQFAEVCDRRGEISRLQLSQILHQASPASDNGTLAQWECETDSGWEPYNDHVGSWLELCFRTKRRCQVTLSKDDAVKKDIAFDPDWTQINPQTGKKRRIRRLIVSWQLLTGDGWSSCDSATGLQLSGAYAALVQKRLPGRSVSMPIHGYTSIVDFGNNSDGPLANMTLTNLKLGTRRPLRRRLGHQKNPANPPAPHAAPLAVDAVPLPLPPPPSGRFAWQVLLDRGWTDFDAQTALLLEQNYESHTETSFAVKGGAKYRIDWTKMVQVNKALGSERMVRRVPPIPVTAREFKIVTFAPPASAQPGDVMELTVDGQVVSVEAPADLIAGDEMEVRIPLKRQNSYSPSSSKKKPPDWSGPAEQEQVIWEWQSGQGWNPYEDKVSADMEMAYRTKDFFLFSAAGQQYTVKWDKWQQSNVVNGSIRSIRRRVVPKTADIAAPGGNVGPSGVVVAAAAAGVALGVAASNVPASAAGAAKDAASAAATAVSNSAPGALAAAADTTKDAAATAAAAASAAATAVSNSAPGALAAAADTTKDAGATAAAAASAAAGVVSNVNIVKHAKTGGAVLLSSVRGAANNDVIRGAAVTVVKTARNVVEFAVGNSSAVKSALKGLMKLGRVIPVFGGLAQLVSDIGIAAEQAAYNKIAAKHLNSRVEELTVVLMDMFKEITPEKFIPSLKLEVERLEPCLEKALKFVEKFKKKGYLRKLLMGDSIKEKIQALDKEITDCVQSIGLSLQLTSIKMHNQMYDQLDEVAALVAQSTENNTKPLDPADPAVQQIADKMGIEVMELTEELKVINRKLDDLSGDIASMKGDIDDKLNRLLAAAEAAAAASASAGSHRETVVLHSAETRLYPPENPVAFWNEHFDSKKIPPEEFIPFFEDEFMPNDGPGRPSLDNSERATLISVIDAFPADGVISTIEWKRFCQDVARSKLSMLKFIRSLTDRVAQSGDGGGGSDDGSALAPASALAGGKTQEEIDAYIAANSLSPKGGGN